MSAVIVLYDGLLEGTWLVHSGSAVNTHVIDAKVVVVVTGHCVFSVFLLLSYFNQVMHGLSDAIVMVVLFFSIAIRFAFVLTATCAGSNTTFITAMDRVVHFLVATGVFLRAYTLESVFSIVTVDIIRSASPFVAFFEYVSTVG